MIYATEILALIAVTLSHPISQVSGTPQLPWPVQAGAIAILGGLLWWQMAKTAPQESHRRGEELDRMLKIHKETTMDTNENIRTMTAEIRGMRNDADRHQDLWSKMFVDRPCLGLDGFEKLQEQIHKGG